MTYPFANLTPTAIVFSFLRRVFAVVRKDFTLWLAQFLVIALMVAFALFLFLAVLSAQHDQSVFEVIARAWGLLFA